MAKYNIVISGYYGFHNAGDEAMLLAILQALRQTFDRPEITVISGNPRATADTFHVDTVPRFGILSILKAIFRSDLLISGGGSLLQDVTSWKSMIYYLTIIIVAVLFRKQVFLYSQGIGPVRYRVIRIILKHVLNHVDAITVRDKESKGFLQRLGVHRTIYTTADAVLSLAPVSLDHGKGILERNHIDRSKKLVGIAIRSWADTERWMVPFRQFVERLASEKDVSVVLIPMQFPEDKVTAEKLETKMSHVYVLKESYTIEELISLMGNMDAVIGMRLHAMIFSALMHVPFLGISYDPKIDNFLALIGRKPTCSIRTMDAEKLYEDTCGILDEDPKERDWSGIDALRRQACENVEILESLMNRKEEKK